MRKLPEQETLRTLLEYHDDGLLWWRERPAAYFHDTERFSAQSQANIWNGKNAGKPAFSRINDRGYRVGSLFGKLWLAHRIIWKMAAGIEPVVIDHIDGDTLNNRIANLRNTDFRGNATNQKSYVTNSSGHVGVTRTPHGRYKAQIGNKGKTEYLGCFTTLDGAARARAEAERRFGYHENHGRERTGGEQ